MTCLEQVRNNQNSAIIIKQTNEEKSDKLEFKLNVYFMLFLAEEGKYEAIH